MKNPHNIYRSKLGCLITPYKQYQCREIETSASLYDKVYRKWEPFLGFVLPYKGNTAFLTYHRDIDYLRFRFPNYTIIDILETKYRNLLNKIHLTGIESLRPAQTEMVDMIRDTVKFGKPWFINLQTGEGKTILGIYLSTLFNVKTWIMCFSDEILDQWIINYLSNTDIDPNRILKVTGSVLEDLKNENIDANNYDIFLCTPGLITSHALNDNDYSYITSLMEICGIGLLIYDEAHRHLSNLVKISAVTNIKYQLFLSADFGQGDFKKEKMFQDMFNDTIVLTPSADLKTSMKYTKITVIDFNTKPKNVDELAIFNKYGYNADLFIQYELSKGILEEAILHILDMVINVNSTYRSLILIPSVAGVDQLYDSISAFIKEKNYSLSVGKFHGKMKSEEKAWTKEYADIIVSTYKSFGTGLDTHDIKYVFATNQSNKIEDNQAAGRARALSDGTDAMYFIFVDNGFDYCKRKLYHRLRYLLQTKSSTEKPFVYHYLPLDYTI